MKGVFKCLNNVLYKSTPISCRFPASSTGSPSSVCSPCTHRNVPFPFTIGSIYHRSEAPESPFSLLRSVVVTDPKQRPSPRKRSSLSFRDISILLVEKSTIMNWRLVLTTPRVLIRSMKLKKIGVIQVDILSIKNIKFY